jgi:hypothetical protein
MRKYHVLGTESVGYLVTKNTNIFEGDTASSLCRLENPVSTFAKLGWFKDKVSSTYALRNPTASHHCNTSFGRPTVPLIPPQLHQGRQC